MPSTIHRLYNKDFKEVKKGLLIGTIIAVAGLAIPAFFSIGMIIAQCR